MSDKPKKLSNFTGLDDANKLSQYISNLDNDVSNIVQYLDRLPRMFNQSAQPTIQNDTFAFWEDSDDNKFYLLWNRNGTTKTVELT